MNATNGTALDEARDMARIRRVALKALGLAGSPRTTVLLVEELAKRVRAERKRG